MVSQPWRIKSWYVAPWNYCDPLKKRLNLPQDLSLHDITLRDGEQFAGIELNSRDRIRIVEKLVETGIQRIEGGRVSDAEEKNSTIKEIVNLNSGVPILGLTEMSVEDIHRAAECGVDGNDFGMVSANTIIALASGAEVAHTSILGLGERVGNASFEEVSLTLLAMFQRDLKIRTKHLFL